MKGITSVRLVEVIRTETSVGKGTKEDPVRIEVQYWDKDGKLISGKSQLEDKKA